MGASSTAGGVHPHVPGPLGVSGTVLTALGLYRADAGPLWAAIAMVIVPVQALIVALSLIAVPRGSVLMNTSVVVPARAAGAYGDVSSFGTLLSTLALLLCIGAAYRILLGRHLHHPAGLRESFSFARERAAGLLWVSILIAFGVFIGLVCFVVPGIYLLVSFAVAVPVLMTEGGRGLVALQRSRALISGHWFHVLGCLLAAAALVLLGQGLVALVIGPITRALSPHSVAGFLLIDAALSALSTVIVAPFSAAVSTVLYVDMLLRRSDPYLALLLA